jgi:autotransporter-associated beta strand protein
MEKPGAALTGMASRYDGGTVIESGTLLLEWPGDGVSHTTLGSGPVTLDGGTLTCKQLKRPGQR